MKIKTSDERIIEHISLDRSYQWKLLIVACCIWGFLDLFSLSLGLLEIKPQIAIYSKTNNTIIYEGPLDYEYCNQTFKITETNKASLVSYFDIYCSAYLVALIGAVNFIGVLVGTTVAPFVVDRYRRKKPIIVACLIHSIVLFASTFSKSIYIMYIFIFFCGFSNLISHLAVFILLNEVATKENRAIYSTIVFNSFALFGILYSFEFYIFENWKTVFYITSFCVFCIFILAALFLRESPRYLLLKHDKAFKTKMMKKIFNYGRENSPVSRRGSKIIIIPQEFKLSSDRSIQETLLDKKQVEEAKKDVKADIVVRKNAIVILLTNNHIKWVFLTMCLAWFSIAGTYYGVLIMLKDTEGNIYLIYTIMYVLEVAANFLAAYIIEIPGFGRRKSIIYLHLATVIVSVLNVLLHKSYWHTSLVILLRFLVATLFSINYVYSTEFYPTDIRAQGLAFNALFGRVGSIISPFLVEILGRKFFIYCAVLFVFCYATSYILQETYGTELSQFTEDSDTDSADDMDK